MDSNQVDQLRNLAHQKLVEKGEKERLKGLLKSRLLESGFNDNIFNMCKEYIKTRGIESLKIDEIVEKITPEARRTVPDSVKRELLQHIKAFLSEEFPHE